MNSSFSDLLEQLALKLATTAGGQDSVDDIRAHLQALLVELPSDVAELRQRTISCIAAAARAASDKEAWLALIVERFKALQFTAHQLMSPVMAADSEESIAGATGALQLPEWVDDELLTDFISSQRLALTELEGSLLSLESGETIDLREFKGQLHTLKGESGTVGLADLQHVYHTWEDLLDSTPDPTQIVEQMLAAQDWVVAALGAYACGEHPPTPVAPILALLSGQPAATPAAAPEEARVTGSRPSTARGAADHLPG